jgi:uncharacterized membrane protein
MSTALDATAGKTKLGNLDYNIAALACYVPVMGINAIASLAFFFTEPKESKLVRFHAVQGLFVVGGLFVAMFADVLLSVVFGVIAGFINSGMLMTLASLASSLLMLLVLVAFLAAEALGMYMAFQGKVFRIPVIGQIADKMTG